MTEDFHTIQKRASDLLLLQTWFFYKRSPYSLLVIVLQSQRKEALNTPQLLPELLERCSTINNREIQFGKYLMWGFELSEY
jgi:endonuclease III